MQRFDLVLDWLPNVQFAGPCWALAHGFYRDSGIDLAIVPWEEDGRTIFEKTLARTVPAAGSAEDNLVIGARAHHGLAVRGLAAMFLTTPLVVMTSPESGIETLADLRGKRVAMHSDGNRILEAMLEDSGISFGELEIDEVTHDLDNLSSGRWDAVQGYAVSEPLELASRGVPVNTLALRSPRLHPFAQVIFALDTAVSAAPDLYRAMLAATFKGWDAALDDPVGAAAAIREVGAPMADVTKQEEGLALVRRLVRGEAEDQARGLGVIDPQRWARNVEAYIRAGILPSGTALWDALDQQLWGGGDPIHALASTGAKS